jgi:hypothetical protein
VGWKIGDTVRKNAIATIIWRGESARTDNPMWERKMSTAPSSGENQPDIKSSPSNHRHWTLLLGE